MDFKDQRKKKDNKMKKGEEILIVCERNGSCIPRKEGTVDVHAATMISL